jgi:recombinational DNA repair ATPase RecF
MLPENSTPRFKNLTVQGFRRLNDVQMPLRPRSVMIGANGAGKTSILDVLSLLAKSAQGKMADANRILKNKDLRIAAEQCPELKAFLSTILTLSGGQGL